MAEALNTQDWTDSDDDIPFDGTSFSMREASAVLRIPPPLLRTLLRVPGLCPLWEHTGRVSEQAVRLLYARLHPQAVIGAVAGAGP